MSTIRHYFFQRYLPPGDKIRAIFHRHFFVALPNILFWLAVPVVTVCWFAYKWFYPEILTNNFLWLFEAYIFLLFFIMLYKVLDWYCDVWIITERGIIDVRWSLFMQDTHFTEFHDISGIQAHQGSVFDKLFKIGDITLHKMGDELFISRMYMPDVIVAAVQGNLQQHHHEEGKSGSDMHIYLDGVRQNHVAVPYKSGFRYVPSEKDDEKFIQSVKKQPGTIDLSGGKVEIVDDKKQHHSHHEPKDHGHHEGHGHDHGHHN